MMLSDSILRKQILKVAWLTSRLRQSNGEFACQIERLSIETPTGPFPEAAGI
jgi:hypothetical protein